MWKRAVLFLSLLAASTAAQAAPLNLYVGASLGNAGEVDGGLADLDFDVDAEDTTWKVFAGAGLGRVLGVEAAWHDFGTTTCCRERVADAGFRLGAEGVSVAAVAGIPISRLRLFAKLGLLSWRLDGDLETIAGPIPFSAEGEDLMGGVGADLKLLGKLSARAEWEVFEVDGDGLDIVSVGVQVRF